MNRIEKVVLYSALLFLIGVTLAYVVQFARSPISTATSDWGALGDYFGGIVGPILSFILVLLIITEAVDNRRNARESRSLELRSQAQVDSQISLLVPQPEIVYYLFARGTKVFAAIENIGNATAYNVKLTATFDSKVTTYVSEIFGRLSHFNYFPPHYKASIFIGHIVMTHEVSGIPTHSVSITFSPTTNTLWSNHRDYVVDKNMLGTLHSEADYSEPLSKIASEIKSHRNSK